MHDHRGSGGGAGGALNLLPTWLMVVWALVLGAVLAVHVAHLVKATRVNAARVNAPAGRASRAVRVHHGVHALMTAGMVYMFIPWTSAPVHAAFWQAAFAAATLGLLAGIIHRTQTHPVPALWWLALGDLAAMWYMFTLFNGGNVWLSTTLVGVYVALAAGWCHAVFDPAPTEGGAAGAERPPTPVPVPAPVAGLRLAHVAMAVAMAHMFAAMDTHIGLVLHRAFTSGVDEETYWVAAIIGLTIRVFADRRLVRRLAGVPATPPATPARRPARAPADGTDRQLADGVVQAVR